MSTRPQALSRNNSTAGEVLEGYSENTSQVFDDNQKLQYAGACMALLIDDMGCTDGWATSFVKTLFVHLGLMPEVEASLWGMCEMGGHPEPFLDGLKSEGTAVCHLILHDLLIAGVLVDEGTYDARLRVLIRQLAFGLGVPWDEVQARENMLAEALYNQLDDVTISKGERKKFSTPGRKLWISGAFLVGGSAMAVAGILAAPTAVGTAAGVAGAAFGSSSAIVGAIGMAGTPVGVGIISSLFGVGGGGLSAYHVSKYTSGVSEFSFVSMNPQKTSSMKVFLCVSGWLVYKSDITRPWNSVPDLTHVAEGFGLQWETKALLELGNILKKFLAKKVVQMFAKQVLVTVGLGAVMHAVAIPMGLMSAVALVDNPWSVCMDKAKKAGRLLSRVLLKRVQGGRPVTLIGYSMGARLIFYCLQELYKARAYGIVEDVFLFGTPINAGRRRWNRVASVVSGRLVNGYCRSDVILGLMYRTSTLSVRVAGLKPVPSVFVENVDLTGVIEGHLEYRVRMWEVLKRFGIGDEAVAVGSFGLAGDGSGKESDAKFGNVFGKPRKSDVDVVSVLRARDQDLTPSGEREDFDADDSARARVLTWVSASAQGIARAGNEVVDKLKDKRSKKGSVKGYSPVMMQEATDHEESDFGELEARARAASSPSGAETPEVVNGMLLSKMYASQTQGGRVGIQSKAVKTYGGFTNPQDQWVGGTSPGKFDDILNESGMRKRKGVNAGAGSSIGPPAQSSAEMMNNLYGQLNAMSLHPSCPPNRSQQLPIDRPTSADVTGRTDHERHRGYSLTESDRHSLSKELAGIRTDLGASSPNRPSTTSTPGCVRKGKGLRAANAPTTSQDMLQARGSRLSMKAPVPKFRYLDDSAVDGDDDDDYESDNASLDEL